jgi:hypothetical protein
MVCWTETCSTGWQILKCCAGLYYFICIVVCDSSVGIATCYCLDSTEIEFRWRRDFPNPPRPALTDQLWSPPSLLYIGYRVSFPGVKRLGRGVDHPPPSSAEVKDRVELYLYSPSEPYWSVVWWNLPLRLLHYYSMQYSTTGWIRIQLISKILLWFCINGCPAREERKYNGGRSKRT